VGAAQLDEVGRVLDFSVSKEKLCMWLEDNYDHKFLIWEDDPMLEELQKLTAESLVIVPFNPTAENIAQHLVEVIAPQQLRDTACRLIRCKVEESQKCWATYKT